MNNQTPFKMSNGNVTISIDFKTEEHDFVSALVMLSLLEDVIKKEIMTQVNTVEDSKNECNS